MSRLSPAAVGLAWAGLALAAALILRPVRWRRADLRADSRANATAPAARPGLVEGLGTLVLRADPRAWGGARPKSSDARRVGATVLAGLLPLPLLPWAAALAAVTAWCLPPISARRRERRRQAVIADDLPEVVDLLMVGTGAGLSVRHAVAAVGRHGQGPLAAELRRVDAEVARGRRLADALDDLPGRAGEASRPLVAALAGTERYGAALEPRLDRLVDEVRAARRRRSEEAARRVPVKLLFPLVGCILPAFGLLTVAPLIAGALRTLRLP